MYGCGEGVTWRLRQTDNRRDSARERGKTVAKALRDNITPRASGSLTLETSKALLHFHNKWHEQGIPILLVDGIVRMGFGLKVGESSLLLQTLLLRIYQEHFGIY